jgi:hypothetical protein
MRGMWLIQIARAAGDRGKVRKLTGYINDLVSVYLEAR